MGTPTQDEVVAVTTQAPRTFNEADVRWLFNNYGFGSVPTDDDTLTDDRLADFVADLNDRAATAERERVKVLEAALDRLSKWADSMPDALLDSADPRFAWWNDGAPMRHQARAALTGGPSGE
jgi:hypothetical protein